MCNTELSGEGIMWTLDVYENYLDKTGKKIPIDVVLLPARILDPSKSAFTFHWGGNGGAAKDKVWFLRPGSSADKIRANRDVVVIDDRGTGASNIRCAAMDSLQPYSYAFVYDEELIKACLNEVKDKVNLELYNTPGVVRDYEQVRKWLGLSQFDFYGISYGVRVGLEYMRNFPKNLRTITVQGCVPPQFKYVNEMDKSVQEQLDILIQRCTSDSICKTYYPNFKTQLYEIRDRLAITPYQFQYELDHGKSIQIKIDDLLFRRIVGHQILHGDTYEILPMLINHAYNENYVPLILAGGGLNLDMPVFLSQFCSEEIDRFDFNLPEKQQESLFTQGAIAEEKKFACELWGDLPEADWLDEPLINDCPILILTGEYDANTPIRMGEQIKTIFPNASRHLILPFQGHASSETNCRYNIISQFIENKNFYELDTTCLNSIEPSPFMFEENLSDSDFEKYVGQYSCDDPGKILKVYKHNGVFCLEDEYSQWTGPSQVLYKGNHTFGVIDCEPCRLIFEMENNKPVQVKRVYRETLIFTPEKNAE